MPGGGGCSATGGLFVVFSLLCFVGKGEELGGVFFCLFCFSKMLLFFFFFWSVVLNSMTNRT